MVNILSKIKNVIAAVLTSIGGLIILVLIFWASSSVQKVPPDGLIVLADHKYKTYISPECLNPNINYDTDEFEPVSWSIASEQMGYDYESDCTYESLFPSRNSAWDFIGTKIGFLKPLNWKWNEDGTWKRESLE